MTTNTLKQLNFSGCHIEAVAVDNVQGYSIGKNPTIVINPQMEDAHIGEPPKKNVIPPLSSTTLKNTTIAEAKSLILLEIKDTTNLGNIILEDGWNLLGDIIEEQPREVTDEKPFPKNTPLWISPQDDIGIVEVDPYWMTRQTTKGNRNETFLVKANLWFAPGNTNCAIHNKHDFIEIHTQVVGIGRMQKFKQQSYDTLYEDMIMAPGQTTYVPFCQVEGSGKYVYPWHQYYSDNDCIWMVIEYHPVKQK